MSVTDPRRPEDHDDDSLAAEYALGLLSSAERLALALRIETDAGFAALVAGWEERFLPLADGFVPETPPLRVKRDLDRRLFGAGAPRAGLWSSLGFWRSLAGVATAAFLIAVTLPLLDTPPEPAPRLMASLTAAGSDVHFMAVYDPAQGGIGLTHISGAPGAGRDFELWIVRADEAPVSLGLIPAGAAVRLALEDRHRAMMGAGAHIAISVEPPGGSPTGQPTGPVVALGDLHAL